MTELERFIEEHSDWKEILALPPYNLKITSKGLYTMLKYNQIAKDTDWYNPIVNECRGIIVDSKGRVVCHGFDRFYNYGEPYAADINWNTATAAEKVDGSLIKIWKGIGGELLISTNGSIDAFDVALAKMTGEKNNISFGDKVVELLEKKSNEVYVNIVEYLKYSMAIGDVHMFELVGPLNKVVLDYNEDLVYLGSRSDDMYLGEFIYQNTYLSNIFTTPKSYDIHNMTGDEVRAMVDLMKGKEGIVVTDGMVIV